MYDANTFVTEMLDQGFDFCAGVPCSLLTPLFNQIVGRRRIPYVGATIEGEAAAVVAGAALAGRTTFLMCQNSGLGNMVNVLTSLNYPFRIPSLLIITWRGRPGVKDEPQHELMGRITPSLLDAVQIGYTALSHEDASSCRSEVEAALSAMRRSGLPYALIVPENFFREEDLHERPPPEHVPGHFEDRTDRRRSPPKRIRVLERLIGALPETAGIVATTGKCGRELFTAADRPQHLYMVGAMGSASAVGLGLALNTPRPIVVVDGDGAALMRLGTLATIGALRPPNLVHVVLDNGTHDSTGGQQTCASSVSFPRIAQACSYRSALSCDDLDDMERALRAAVSQPGPHLLHVRIERGSIAALARPTISPADVAKRFSAFICAPLTERVPERAADLQPDGPGLPAGAIETQQVLGNDLPAEPAVAMPEPLSAARTETARHAI